MSQPLVSRENSILTEGNMSMLDTAKSHCKTKKKKKMVH